MNQLGDRLKDVMAIVMASQPPPPHNPLIRSPLIPALPVRDIQVAGGVQAHYGSMGRALFYLPTNLCRNKSTNQPNGMLNVGKYR